MQELIQNTNEALTMTSLEIAELTGKQHSHVMRDIENTLKELCQVSDDSDDKSKVGLIENDGFLGVKGIVETFYKAPAINNSFRNAKMYELDRENIMILCMGYSIPLRQKIVRRLEELEAQVLTLTQENLTLTQENLALAQETIKALEQDVRINKVDMDGLTLGTKSMAYRKLRVDYIDTKKAYKGMYEECAKLKVEETALHRVINDFEEQGKVTIGDIIKSSEKHGADIW
jgi:phage regulator Rha-like protein